MSYTRNKGFRGFQSTISNQRLLKFDFSLQGILKRTLIQTAICLGIIAIIFTLKIIDKGVTNNIIRTIDTGINSNINYTYYFNRIKALPKYALEKGERAIEVISIPTFNQVTYGIPAEGEIISFFDKSATSAQTNNRGIIINTTNSERVYASSDGIVMETGTKENIGGYVIIKHKGNILTIYKFLRESLVENNQTVKKGDLIGLSTEKLQFEVWDKNNPMDPLRYLDLK